MAGLEKLTAQQARELVRRAAAGEPLPTLASDFHLTTETARRYCNLAGLTHRLMFEARRRRTARPTG